MWERNIEGRPQAGRRTTGLMWLPHQPFFLIDSGPPETVREAISAFPAPPETYMR